MKIRHLAGILAISLLALTVAQSKPKKPDVPAVFADARYVYVQAEEGDALRPSLYSEDRQAIYDVQDSLRAWNRYLVVFDRDQADLIFIVRKGRLAAAQIHGGISAGSRPQPNQSPNANPGSSPNPGVGQPRGTEVGVGAEVGPPDDFLRVFIQAEGKLTSVVWSREMEDGLNAPSVQLVKELKAAVERAYPQTTTSNQHP